MYLSAEHSFYEQIQFEKIILFQKIEHLLTHQQRAWIEKTEVQLSRRLRTSLGRAYLKENRIELNLRLLTRHPEELLPTLAHEYAHLVAPLIFGELGVGHQAGWKKVMQLFGASATRTHSLSINDLRYVHTVVAFASCGCPGYKHEIKSRRLKKMKKQRQKYSCRKCKEMIQLA